MAHSFLHIAKGVGLSSLGTALGALLAIVTVKVLAVTLGPSGTGFYSLIKQIVQTCITAATLNSQSAIVQAIASQRDHDSRSRYLGAATRAVIIATIMVSLAMLLGADRLALQIMPSAPEQFALAIHYSVAVVVCGAAATLLAGVMNGYRELAVLAFVQVSSALAALIIVGPVATWSESQGSAALVLLLAISQVVALIVYMVRAKRLGVLKELSPIQSSIVPAEMRHFVSISGATLFAGLTTAGTMLAVRALVARTHGLEGAGLFDAAYTVSAGYVGLLLGGFGTYYMPALAAIKNPLERVIFMRRMLLLTAAVSAPLLATLAFLRSPVISMLYSEQYAGAAEVLRFFVIGDFLKACAWVFAYLLIAFPNMRVLLLCELSWNLGFLILCASALYVGLPLEALGVAYALMYCTYLAALVLYAKRAHGFTFSTRGILLWMFAAACVGVAAI